MSDLINGIKSERVKKYNLALKEYEEYRWNKIFDSVPLPSYIPEKDLDIDKSKYRDFDYNSLKYGKHFLFQTVAFHVVDGIQKYEMSKPILGTFIEYGVVDQAIEYKFICPPRTWELNHRHNNKFGENKDISLYDLDVKVETVLEWSQFIFIFGIWDKFPDWKEMKTSMKETFYYRLSRKEKIKRILS